MAIKDVPIADSDSKESVDYAFMNIWIFSIGLNGLYFYPWFLFHETWLQRLERATMNWVSLSVFEEVVFQFPHNIFELELAKIQDSNNIFAWPFWVYGLCDSRWNEYNNNGYRDGLPWFTWTSNLFEGGSGMIIILIVLLQKYYFSQKYNFQTAFTNNEFGCDFGCTSKRDNKSRRTYLFILVILFRDAMLLRQTFSYLTDQHIEDYPFSFDKFGYKTEAITGLYVINGLWILAPMTTAIWAYVNFRIGLNQQTLLLKQENDINNVPGVVDLIELEVHNNV